MKKPALSGLFHRVTSRSIDALQPATEASRGMLSLGVLYALILVPEVGIEPTLGFPNQILSLARLPVSPLRRESRKL